MVCGRWSDFHCVLGGVRLNNRNPRPIAAESLQAVKVDIEHGGKERVARAENFLYTKYTMGDVTKISQGNRLTKCLRRCILIATGHEALATSQEHKK